MTTPPYGNRATARLLARHGALFNGIRTPRMVARPDDDPHVLDLVRARGREIGRLAVRTVRDQRTASGEAVDLIRG